MRQGQRAQARARRGQLRRSARADLRAARPQWRGQVDPDQHPCRAGRSRPAGRRRCGASTSTSTRATPSARSASCRRNCCSTPSSPRARRSRSRPACTACPRPSGSPTPCSPRSTCSDKADAYARTLSGGMKRRLLVAKAMVHSPPILVLDEPTAGVDIELRQQLWDYVKGLNAQGVTVVLTTHYLEEAEQLCDRIAIINHGKLIANEPTRELIAKAQDKAVVVEVDRDVDRRARRALLRPGRPDRAADARNHLPQGPRQRRRSARRAGRRRARHRRRLDPRSRPRGRVPGADPGRDAA